MAEDPKTTLELKEGLWSTYLWGSPLVQLTLINSQEWLAATFATNRSCQFSTGSSQTSTLVSVFAKGWWLKDIYRVSVGRICNLGGPQISLPMATSSAKCALCFDCCCSVLLSAAWPSARKCCCSASSPCIKLGCGPYRLRLAPAYASSWVLTHICKIAKKITTPQWKAPSAGNVAIIRETLLLLIEPSNYQQKTFQLMELTPRWNAQLNPHSTSKKPNPWPTFSDESEGETPTPPIFCKWSLEKQQKYWTERISQLGSNWISRHARSYKKSKETINFQIHGNQLQGCKEHTLYLRLWQAFRLEQITKSPSLLICLSLPLWMFPKLCQARHTCWCMANAPHALCGLLKINQLQSAAKETKKNFIIVKAYDPRLAPSLPT